MSQGFASELITVGSDKWSLGVMVVNSNALIKKRQSNTPRDKKNTCGTPESWTR